MRDLCDRRIFLYLRASADGVEIARTKVREVAGLASAMAELAGRLLSLDRNVARGGLRIEYVDAQNDSALISLWPDLERAEQVIEGRIPERYRDRMIDNPPTIDIDRFEEKAGRDLDASTRWEIHERLRSPRFDVLSLIRSAIREDGSFAVRVPMVR